MKLKNKKETTLEFPTTKLATEYCVNLSRKEMLVIVEEDKIRDRSLCAILESIDGVKKVDYDGHYGPHIFLTVECEDDNKTTWKVVMKAITDYCYC